MPAEDKMNMEFDITPEQGIELQPLPQVETEEEVPQEAQETVDETTEESLEEETESQPDEEQTEIEAQDEGLDMSIGQFANAAGVTLKDVYGLKMPDGRTLSQAVDEGKEQAQAAQSLRTQIDQLQRQLQETSRPQPQDDIEALKLETEAQIFQRQLDNADFSQMDQGQAANLRLTYMNTIQQLKDAAQQKRTESNGKMQQQAHEALVKANTELLSAIPSWNSNEVYANDNKAMGDFLRNRGFSDMDLFAIDRAPIVKHLVYDAWKALAKQKEIREGAKKVRKIGKVLKPGARQGPRKASLKEVGKEINKGGTRADKQRRRLSAEFDL